jgi:hypothetical protein
MKIQLSAVLLPDIAVPLATQTRWNPYRAPVRETELCDRDGTHANYMARYMARVRSDELARLFAPSVVGQTAQ